MTILRTERDIQERAVGVGDIGAGRPPHGTALQLCKTLQGSTLSKAVSFDRQHPTNFDLREPRLAMRCEVESCECASSEQKSERLGSGRACSPLHRLGGLV